MPFLLINGLIMSTHHRLPDTRAYPATPVKGELLANATQMVYGRDAEHRAPAARWVEQNIRAMLARHHYTALSVALSMAPDMPVYRALWQSLAKVLEAENEEECQWLVLPVVVVAGCNQDLALPDTVPTAAINQVLAQQAGGELWPQVIWLPQLFNAADLSHIKADAWFASKQNAQAAAALATEIQATPLRIPAGQSVQVFYALGYGPQTVQPLLRQALGEAALPLMQVWQNHLATSGATLFTNPLPPLAPLAAIHEGSALRLRMASDVFATNALRAIRLQSPRAGVVIAAQEGGRLLFGFNATDSAFETVAQVFAWPLSPLDDIDNVVQNFIDLLAECQVEHIRLLHEALPEQVELPCYAQALNLPGHNPLFADSH